MANLADDDLLLVQRTSAGISTNYSITGSALKEDLTGVTGLIANPVEVLTPLDGSGLSGDISYYPETSAVTDVVELTDQEITVTGSFYSVGGSTQQGTVTNVVDADTSNQFGGLFNSDNNAGSWAEIQFSPALKVNSTGNIVAHIAINVDGISGDQKGSRITVNGSVLGDFSGTEALGVFTDIDLGTKELSSLRLTSLWDIHYGGFTINHLKADGTILTAPFISTQNETILTLTNDKVFDSSNGTEMSTVDQVLTAGTVVEGESDSTVLTSAFSATTWTGNSYTRTINSGIDNTTESLVWIKNRDAADNHRLFDTIRGPEKVLSTNSGGYSYTATSSELSAFTSTGFDLGTGSGVNYNTHKYVSWNFRAAPNFFDIVTYSGTGSPMTVAHSLGSVPGMMIIKKTNDSSGWYVYHKDLGIDHTIFLDSSGTGSTLTGSNQMWASTPTSSEFYLGVNVNTIGSGKDYVAYLFAEDTPGLIKCGRYSGTGGNTVVDVGFKPGWIMVKSCTASSQDWAIFDNARPGEYLSPNSGNGSSPAASDYNYEFTETGVSFNQLAGVSCLDGVDYIYVAIAENAMSGDFAPTGTLTADANPSDPSITLTDVTGTWTSGMTAVGQTQLTKYAAGPDDITFTSQNAGTTPFNGTDATLAFRRWTLESRASAGDPWVVVDTYEDYDIVASQDGATPWSSNKPTLAPNTMYRVKVAYISTNADPVESVYNTFTTGSN